MKKIGKNTKLYLIGMIIGGITLGITTVIADTIINSTSVAYKTTTVKAALDELYDIADFKQEVKDMLYPVGSIYISVSGTNPSELFGGTWVSFGMGRTLLGVGDLKLNPNNYSGDGEKALPDDWSYHHVNSEVYGGELYHKLTVDEMPAHLHEIETLRSGSNWITYYASISGESTTVGSEAIGGSPTGYKLVKTITGGFWLRGAPTGGGKYHNNVSPYVTVYMWKRIS